FAPAKRLRPILSLLVADVLRGHPETVLPAGCAIEMVHTASLILDDLPCMDDAATRRGRPTCHVAHGESTAILAAFALLNRAFEIIDDLIDATSGAAEAGKDVGKDLKKTTFVSFSGVAGARDLAHELIAASQEALAGFGPRAQPLRELGRYVVTRRR